MALTKPNKRTMNYKTNLRRTNRLPTVDEIADRKAKVTLSTKRSLILDAVKKQLKGTDLSQFLNDPKLKLEAKRQLAIEQLKQNEKERIFLKEIDGVALRFSEKRTKIALLARELNLTVEEVRLFSQNYINNIINYAESIRFRFRKDIEELPETTRRKLWTVLLNVHYLSRYFDYRYNEVSELRKQLGFKDMTANDLRATTKDSSDLM